MQRQIVATIEGEINELLANWTPPHDMELEVIEPEKSLETVFLNDNISEFCKLEAIVDKLSGKHEIELISTFQAYDFLKEELEASDLLWFRVLETKGLEIEGINPLKFNRCKRCGTANFWMEKQKRLNLKVSPRNCEIPKSHILSVDSIKLFHHELIEKLRLNKIDIGLMTMPCLIKGPNGILNEDYFVGFSLADLGLPTGGMKLSDKNCPECGKPEVIKNRGFLTTFHRENWHKEDFCTSNFFGNDFLYVSQSIFRFIDSLPKNIKGNVIFEPIDLI